MAAEPIVVRANFRQAFNVSNAWMVLRFEYSPMRRAEPPQYVPTSAIPPFCRLLAKTVTSCLQDVPINRMGYSHKKAQTFVPSRSRNFCGNLV